MYIYKNISDILERKKILQKDLATEMGVGANTVNNWLKYKKGIRVEQLPEIAKALRVPISALFGEEYNTNQDTLKDDKGGNTLPASSENTEQLLKAKDQLINHLEKQVEWLKNRYEKLLDRLEEDAG